MGTHPEWPQALVSPELQGFEHDYIYILTQQENCFSTSSTEII